MLTLLADATQAGLAWQDIINSVLIAAAGVVTALVGFAGRWLVALIRARVQSKWLADALVALETAAESGVKVAWYTYTEAVKEAKKDGVLTDEEARVARIKAWDAAISSVGAGGIEILKRGLGDGWADALKTALEKRYGDLKPVLTNGGATPDAPSPP